MKHLCFLFTIVSVCSCTSREPLKIIQDYEVGFNLDGKIRTYYYAREMEKDTLIVTFIPSKENGIQYVTEYSRTPSRFLGDRKFRIEKGMKDLVHASHFYYPDESVDTYDSMAIEILNIESVPGEKYNGGRFHYKSRTKSDIVNKYSVEETFDKDTTYMWNGEMLPSLKFREQSHYSTFYRYLPFYKNMNADTDGFVVFAKGIGLVYIRVISDEYPNTIVLVKATEQYAGVHTSVEF